MSFALSVKVRTSDMHISIDTFLLLLWNVNQLFLDKEEKKVVKTSFLKCLKDLHLFIKFELSKDQSAPVKDLGHLSRFGMEAAQQNADPAESIILNKGEEKPKSSSAASFGRRQGGEGLGGESIGDEGSIIKTSRGGKYIKINLFTLVSWIFLL